MKFTTENWGDTGKFRVIVQANMNMKDGVSTLLYAENAKKIIRKEPPKYPQPTR